MQFRNTPFLVGLLLFFAGCAGSQSSTQTASTAESESVTTSTEALLTYQDKVTPDFLKKHLTPFSADSMQGRETGTEGLKKAADYLARQYRQLGLQPVGDDNSYFQHFKLNASVSDSIVFKTYFHEEGHKKLMDRSVASAQTTGNYIRAFGGTDTLSGKIVYAGAGLNDSENNVMHLGAANLKGKWVMVFQEIPHVVNGDTLINPQMDNRSRFQAIMNKGAKGILTIPALNSEQFQASAKQSQSSFGQRGSMTLAYRDNNGGSGGFNRGYNVINPQLAAQLLGVDDIATARDRLIANITDFSPRTLNYSLSHTPYSSSDTIGTKNVVAFYEGADPELKDEVVVMTSHYDHLGVGEPDSTGDRIYNGADDDGSGTIGLLNIAKAFADAGKDGIMPKRSILFLHVSAEEKGLLGSRYYSDHAIFPIDKTIANINTDMIGRVDPKHKKEGVEDYTYLIGADIISSDLDSVIKAANKRSGELELDMRYNDLDDPNQFYRRSDHWHFGRKRVPFVFFFTGVHEDYHQPSDEVHKIRFDKTAKIVRTMYATAVMLANGDNPPVVDNEEFIEITKSDN
ncbi:MAG: M28 family peptidase [Fodinibius sp.]|nr:M28 family peptidase [Fodinibius sp.]